MVKLKAAPAEAVEAEQDQAAAPTEHVNPTRSITLETPKSAKTKIALLFMQDATGFWWTGFDIKRDYDPGNGNKREETDIPDPQVQECNFEYIFDAIEDAADRAETWLSIHSGDHDKKTDLAIQTIQEWFGELKANYADDATYIDDTIFDDAEVEPAASESEAVEEEEEAGEEPEEEEASEEEADAEADYEERRLALDQRIAEQSVLASKLKVRLKVVKKALELDIEERAAMEDRGPERLPLFDKPAKAKTQPAVDDEPEDDSWKAEPLTNLDGLTPKLVEILSTHDIRTMGDLADAPRAKGCELTQLRGITEARFQTIQEATEQFWKTRKQQDAA